MMWVCELMLERLWREAEKARGLKVPLSPSSYLFFFHDLLARICLSLSFLSLLALFKVTTHLGPSLLPTNVCLVVSTWVCLWLSLFAPFLVGFALTD